MACRRRAGAAHLEAEVMRGANVDAGVRARLGVAQHDGAKVGVELELRKLLPLLLIARLGCAHSSRSLETKAAARLRENRVADAAAQRQAMARWYRRRSSLHVSPLRSWARVRVKALRAVSAANVPQGAQSALARSHTEHRALNTARQVYDEHGVQRLLRQAPCQQQPLAIREGARQLRRRWVRCHPDTTTPPRPYPRPPQG